jgi:hypothetical protein
MVHRKAFERDLAFGNAGEKHVIRDFASHGWRVAHRSRDFRYDFEMVHEEDGRMLLVEVKTEPSALRWGNIFLEYECRGKPSGIYKSEADVYVFIIGDRLLSAYRTELLDIAPLYPSKRGGDFDRELGMKVSLGFIVPVKDIETLTRSRDEIRN